MSPAELSAAKEAALRAQREDNELQMAQALSLGLTSTDGLRGNLPLMTKMGGYRGAHPTLTNACSAHQCNWATLFDYFTTYDRVNTYI